MGNTNLPQAGNVGDTNSRATRSGVEQLTDKQQEKRHNSVTELEIPNPAIGPDDAVVGDVDTGHSPDDAT